MHAFAWITMLALGAAAGWGQSVQNQAPQNPAPQNQEPQKKRIAIFDFDNAAVQGGMKLPFAESNTPNLGKAASPEEIASWDISIGPDGAGLPSGSGTPQQGEQVYLAKCLACHGEKGSGKPNDQIHIAFRAGGRQIVRDFYAAAIAAGGTDNGAPGTRPQYHEHYYGGFVRDPDGHNIEACCHEPFLG